MKPPGSRRMLWKSDSIFFCTVVGLILFTPAWSEAQQSPSVVGSFGPVESAPVGPTHSILLPTGKVLYFGEFGKGNRHFLWDPATGTQSELPYAGFNIFCSGHSHLDDGRIFITGGHIDEHVGEPKSVIFDPYALTWHPVPDMPEGRWYPTATTLPNGEVLVVGGETTAGGKNNLLHQVYLPTTNTWRDLIDAASNLPYYTRQFVDLNGDVIIVTPRQRSYRIETEGAGRYVPLGLNLLPQSRTYGGAVMYDTGKIMINGGGVPPTDKVEVLDLNQPSPTWRSVQPMSSPRRQHNSVLLPDGKVLVLGGSSGALFDDRTNPVQHSEVWDPETETWTTWASHSLYRGYHSTALLLPDGRLFTGGSRHDDTVEIFSPPYLFQGARPSITFAPVHVDPGQPFVVMTPDFAKVDKVTLLRLGATTHAFDQNQRISKLEFTPFTGGLVADAPATNNLAPPGDYMLFLIDENGVPSVAEIVRVNNTTLPPLGVGVPSGGEIYLSNTLVTIKWWAKAPTTHVDLAYSPDGGTSWLPIAAGLPNTGSYPWLVPDLLSSFVFVRITDHDDPSRSAINPARFSVYTGPTEDVVPFGSSWRYHADGTYPGANWNLPGFSDSSWSSGKGQFGYGDGDETTLIAKTIPSQTSVYFRKKFEIDQDQLHGVELSAVYDDGIAIWLNGVLIIERHMDSGLEHEKYASVSVDDETLVVLIDQNLLVPGPNTFAVMVKQNGRSSPDLSFDLALRAIRPQTFAIDLLNPVAGKKFGLQQSVGILWESFGYVPEVNLEWSTNGGSNWQTIDTGVVNTGSYEWMTPSSPVSDARLRVFKTIDPTVFAESGPFTIQAATRTVVFPMGSTWRYFDDGTDPGEEWFLPHFPDGGWASGAGELGYGDGDETTVLRKTVPSQTSVYFRKTFNLPHQVAGGEFHARFDDGIAVWINGHEVGSKNIGSTRHIKYAYQGTDNEEITRQIPATVFLTGTNLIAVMVKQNGATSNDLSFDLALTVDALP